MIRNSLIAQRLAKTGNFCLPCARPTQASAFTLYGRAGQPIQRYVNAGRSGLVIPASGPLLTLRIALQRRFHAWE